MQGNAGKASGKDGNHLLWLIKGSEKLENTVPFIAADDGKIINLQQEWGMGNDGQRI
jgi:hypothetical protein